MQTFSNNVIDAMGGTTAVSRLSKTALSTVHSWRKIGIPESRLDHLKLIAEREGMKLDWETGQAVHQGSNTADVEQTSSGKADSISAKVSA